MKTRIALAAVVALLGGTSLSYAAQTLISPALQTGTDTVGACLVRNIGKTPISVRVTALADFASSINPGFQNCNDFPLDAGRTCILQAGLPPNITFECAANVTSGSARNLRATAELRVVLPQTGSEKTIAAADLR